MVNGLAPLSLSFLNANYQKFKHQGKKMGKFKMSKLFVIYQYPSRPIDVEADASEGSAAAAVLALSRAILVADSCDDLFDPARLFSNIN